jgi:UDP-glucose 4-epimerase
MSDLEHAVVTITGGTGSFGSTMLRNLLAKPVAEIRVFSRDEAKQDQLRHLYKDTRLRFIIGDVRDQTSVVRAMRNATHVFHAAALKQVPSAEFFPWEAVRTNIDGSANVIRAAVEQGVKKLVCLSTDKAVYPINAMGMTKALMEKTAQAIAREFIDSPTTIAITRYGNVMYSRGSVIPLFLSQIRSGSKVTITEPTMTRFLMTLDQSVNLVEYAFENAAQGDLFVKKAPAATIQTLAEALIEMFGANKTQIERVGFRHGEKLYESLLSTEELARAEDIGGYYRVPLDERGLNYSAYFSDGQDRPATIESYHSHNTKQLDKTAVIELLMTVPEIREELGL